MTFIINTLKWLFLRKYYYVAYIYAKGSEDGNGHVHISQGGRFPSPVLIEKYLIEENGFKFVSIINIVRISKKEFKMNCKKGAKDEKGR